MKVIDISWPISEHMTEYKDARSVKFSPLKTMEQHSAREWSLALNNHTGTHVDGAAHFLSTGETLDKLDVQKLVGPCRVVDLTFVTDRITVDHVASLGIGAGEIILFKTANSFRNVNDRFIYDFIYLDHTAAQHLAHKNIKAVGFDYLGIERNQPDHETHKAFMQFNIPIIEGLRLAEVTAGTYILCCLPLYMVGIDSAPARAILIDTSTEKFNVV